MDRTWGMVVMSYWYQAHHYGFHIKCYCGSMHHMNCLVHYHNPYGCQTIDFGEWLL